MSRRSAREFVLHMIFDNEFSQNTGEDILERKLEPDYYASFADEADIYKEAQAEAQLAYISEAVKGVIAHRDELDGYIGKYSTDWDVSRISRISKCILRLSMYEVKYMHIPVGASVNEALELSKRYDDEKAAPFINGILASFVKNEMENA